MTVSAVRGDWTADGKAELLVRMSDGSLAAYSYAAGGLRFAKTLVSSVGTTARVYSPGDATYDGRTDLLVDRAGTLTLYGLRGDGRLDTGREVGRGFSGIRLITPGTNWREKTILGNLTVRMYGITATGDMYLYFFTDPCLLRTGAKVGYGWNLFPQVVGVGDVSNDEYGDVVAVDNGNLLLYRGTAAGGLSTAIVVGNGWAGQLAGPGDLNGDGQGDLVLRSADGSTRVYLGGDSTFRSTGVVTTIPGSLVP